MKTFADFFSDLTVLRFVNSIVTIHHHINPKIDKTFDSPQFVDIFGTFVFLKVKRVLMVLG